MRYLTTAFVLLVVFSVIVLGCARAGGDPIIPTDELGTAGATAFAEDADVHDSHMLWGQWIFYFNSDHTAVDAVPVRSGQLHLNTLKFLESYCADCLEITQIKNNGDGTIDLTVKITHPFPDNPEYTGFDVKGIIMFQGSHEIPDNIYKLPFYPENFRLSWRLMGDPELLNADGYSIYWSPWYDSGIDMPIFKYWEGKYSNGTPTANVNGFLDFYSKEERHMFEVGAEVSETYHISLPGGPVVAGYAIDACWEPPLVTPVTNPVEDFPITANQPEAYHFNVVFNDGLPVVPGDNCCSPSSVYETRSEYERWYNAEGTKLQYWMTGVWNEVVVIQKNGFGGDVCNSLPDHPTWRCYMHYYFSTLPDGIYQLFGYAWHANTEPDLDGYYKVLYPAFDVIEITIDFD